jgi:hypothetical protein
MTASDRRISSARQQPASLEAGPADGPSPDQDVVDQPPRRRSDPDPTKRSRARFPGRFAGPASPVALLVLACVALATLSAAALPTVPSYDPWSWIVWGREVTDPHLSFVVTGGPSWKPLPFIFTSAWGLFGGAAPTLWVITARTGGLLGLVAAWRLASRLVGRGRPGAFAGLLAVIGVLLTQDWFYYWFRGTSEVVLIGASLWAIERLLDGHQTQAFMLAVAAGLIRPEWWPFIGLYALWLWFAVPEFKRWPMRLLILAGLFALPLFWFVPPWVGSGDPFLAANHAVDYNGHLGPDRLRAVIGRGIDLQVLPALIAAIAAVAIGWWRERDRVVLAMGAGIAAWWVVVIAMTLDGYPGLERFFLPAAALICVLGGVGIVQMSLLAGRALARHAPAAAVGVGVVLVIACIPFTTTRFSDARAAEPAASRAVSILDQLSAAVAAVGGHKGVYPCKSSFAAVNHGVQTALAWKLHVTLERVGTSMRAPGVDFIGPRNATDGSPARVDPRLTRIATLARVGVWRVVQLSDPRLPPSACVGR